LKKKLAIQTLKVQSFVTSPEKIKGGDSGVHTVCQNTCDTCNVIICNDSGFHFCPP